MDGAWPHGKQVVIDKGTAKKKHLAVGDTIGVAGAGPDRAPPDLGDRQVRQRSEASAARRSPASTCRPRSQLFDKPGQLDEIDIAAKPNVSDQQLLKEVRAVLPANAQARTGAQQAAEDAKDTNSFISFLRGFLLAFGGIALFVGSFVIANSLSITIAQRTREFATYPHDGRDAPPGAARDRRRGARDRDGRVRGRPVPRPRARQGAFKLFNAVGFTLPNSGIIFATRTVIVSMIVGVDRDADREPAAGDPRDARAADRSRARRLDVAAVAVCALPQVGSAIVTAAGFAALLYGLFGNASRDEGVLIWMGVGALLIFVGVSMLSVAVHPAARLGARLAGDAGSAAPPAGSPATTRGATRSGRRRPRPR